MMPIWENNNLTNTVINQTASKSHNIYLLSLVEAATGSGVNPVNIFAQNGLTYGSTVNNKVGRKYPAYIWDMYNLAQQLSTNGVAQDLNESSVNPVTNDISRLTDHFRLSERLPWKTLFANRFTDDSGSSIYSKLQNFTPFAVNNVPKFSAQTYSGNFNFSPLINIGLSDIIQNVVSVSGTNPTDFSGINQLVNDQAGAELLMYFIAKIPLFPFFVCSSINSHYSFGPVFMNSMNFSCSGENGLGTVNIECSFDGGKILVSPEIDLFVKKRPGIEPIVYNEMKDLNNQTISENATNFPGTNYDFDFHRYRSASLLDVIVLDEYEPNFNNLIAKVAANNTGLKYIKNVPNKKIISVDMSISQQISLTHTIPTIDGLQRSDSIGPKYASLDSRTVSGSIKYFGYTDRIYNNIDRGLTLYFGGPFFFPMKNVDWSNPTISISPEGGYTHTYKFTARLPDQVNNPIYVEFPFNKTGSDLYNTNVSEFSYDSYSYDAKDFINDYMESLKEIILSGLGIRSVK